MPLLFLPQDIKLLICNSKIMLITQRHPMQNNKHLGVGVLGATLLIPNAALANISG